MQRYDHQSEQSFDDNPITDEGHVSDPEDTDNAHIPKVPAATWFKLIPEEERPATPEPEWTIPSNDYPKLENNWANVYATTYQDPTENKLQRKTSDIGSFIKWFCKRIGKKKLCKADLEGPTLEEDYTIVNKPRAVIYRDKDDNKKMIRINEVHKFSDGTLMRIRDKLDFMVKDFRLFKFNKGMETRKWTEDDKRRIEDFIEPDRVDIVTLNDGDIKVARVRYSSMIKRIRGSAQRKSAIEHPSESKVFITMKMENLLEPTSKQDLGR
ncbi:hypothetical protein Tco_0976974 [Tanacetum coccineum]|uniref:Uncharacterized protein n=1 Tax=Tanacetum coccineum TaxID=301880 RepID=A0ABQ5EJX6_9ASTR